jgi:hypothetical protein
MIGPKYGWRIPFVVVSLPTMLLSILVLMTVNDPPRRRISGGSNASSRNSRQTESEHGESGAPECSLDDSLFPVDTLRPVGADAGDCSDHSLRHRVPCANVLKSTIELSSVSLEAAQQESLVGSEQNCAISAPGCRKLERRLDADHEGGDCEVENRPKERRWYSTCQQLLSSPTVVLALLQGAPGCVPWGVINTYLNDYLAQNRGMTVEVRDVLRGFVIDVSSYEGMSPIHCDSKAQVLASFV